MHVCSAIFRPARNLSPGQNFARPQIFRPAKNAYQTPVFAIFFKIFDINTYNPYFSQCKHGYI
jgi:hypothetical protein